MTLEELAKAIRELHQQRFASVYDAVWRPSTGFCDECGQSWPCSTIRLLPEEKQ